MPLRMDPIVRTATGAVRGTHHGNHQRFLGIPYAAPPIGVGRFTAPRPHPGWEGVRDTTAHGPNAPQGVRALGELEMSPYFGPGWVRGEDYLTLNIWTPDIADAGLPVMVFVHGGGFVAGSTRSTLYDGSRFARDGVVLVTLNYRLGIPGFLDLPGAPANRGLLDVMAALGWIQANITAFGGAPDNVTLFGQSAGATIVGGILADPRARGLFRRAVVQSGSGLGAFTPEQAARVTRAAAAELGVAAHADAFADLPDERFIDIAPRLSGIDLQTATSRDPLMGLSPFSIVLDQQPAHSVATGHGADVDLLIGTNTQEGNLYLAPFGNLTASTDADVYATAARSHPLPRVLVAAYRHERPRATPGELRSAILADALFGAGTQRLAEAHAGLAKARTYRYEFAWPSPALDGQLGATHAVELPFVFDVTEQPELRGAKAMLGPSEPPAGLAARMHASWIDFATTGDPGWDPYEATRRTTMRIGEEWRLIDNPHSQERQVWN